MAEENPFSVLFNKPAWSGSGQVAALLPGNGQDALKIGLRPHCDEPYECIGYDRTSTAKPVSIEVEAQSHTIPGPLEQALRALRYTDKERYLWADVLIGTSAEERSRQSAAMKSMLEESSKMIAWLGQGDSAINASVFEVLQTLANRWKQSALHAGMPPNWAQSRPNQLITAREKMLSYPPEPLQPGNLELWKAMESVFTSAYFKSVQTIPELVLASKPTIRLGTESMDWEDFVTASRAYVMALAGIKGEAPSDTFMEAFQLLNSHETAVWRYRNDDGLELLPMIQSARDCLSNDPREYVFAMLPITRPSKRKVTKPDKPAADYFKNIQTVFKEAARYIVLERQDLLLWWSERPPCSRRINEVPSWVPDWSVTNPKTGYFASPNNKLRYWSDSLSVPKSITVDDNYGLHVQAHALDRIESVSHIFTPDNCRKLVLAEWEKVPSIPGDTPQTKADRYWRTLIMDYAGLGETRDQPAKPSAELFESWRSLIAEEHVMKLLGCNVHDFFLGPASTELQARARNDPNVAQYAPLTGKSNAFEELLRKNSLGRRFFTTVSGRTGMTEIEQRDDRETNDDRPPVPNFDDAMGDSFGHYYMGAFQQYVQQRDPAAAAALAKGLRGELPGQAPPGVRSNDLIVACVLGFQPYVLRPENANAIDQDVAGNLRAESTYKYVGSCYVHGVMDGEPFITKNWLGRERFRTDVELVDIVIV